MATVIETPVSSLTAFALSSLRPSKITRPVEGIAHLPLRVDRAALSGQVGSAWGHFPPAERATALQGTSIVIARSASFDQVAYDALPEDGDARLNYLLDLHEALREGFVTQLSLAEASQRPGLPLIYTPPPPFTIDQWIDTLKDEIAHLTKTLQRYGRG